MSPLIRIRAHRPRRSGGVVICVAIRRSSARRHACVTLAIDADARNLSPIVDAARGFLQKQMKSSQESARFWVSGRVQARTKRWTPSGGSLEAFSESDGKMGDYIQKSRSWVEGAFWLAPVERLRLGSTRLRPAFLA